ncbi:TRAP transporter small permease [Neobacillus sp. PS2-9]|uniref:TRAP transporter small permease n=1 Tax=Neobacillus sp. PS2-9 TaxID=3070676 RepID=UPI0027DEDFD4|nr:TRAP transporter small permease [Neobacillus sp. PS2-9]WML58752.1 TRAP transporter small permease [Neobacillus sp. PS2-9]
MKGFMTELSKKVDKASKFLLIFFFVIAFVATVYQVFSRFVLQSSIVQKTLPMVDFSVFNLSWAEELIRYMFVWIVFLGIGIVYKSKEHAQVEILLHYLPEKLKGKLQVLIEVINSAVFLFLIVYGFSILKFTSQQISPSMGLNMTLIYGSVLVCSLICLLHSFVNILNLVVGKEEKARIVQVEVANENPHIG